MWYNKFIQSQKSNGHKLIPTRVGVYGFSFSIVAGKIARKRGDARTDVEKDTGSRLLSGVFLFVSTRFIRTSLQGSSVLSNCEPDAWLGQAHKDHEQWKGGPSGSLASIRPLGQERSERATMRIPPYKLWSRSGFLDLKESIDSEFEHDQQNRQSQTLRRGT
jgi:hypothetical protein